MEFIFETTVVNGVMPIIAYCDNSTLNDLIVDVVGNDIPPPKPR